MNIMQGLKRVRYFLFGSPPAESQVLEMTGSARELWEDRHRKLGYQPIVSWPQAQHLKRRCQKNLLSHYRRKRSKGDGDGMAVWQVEQLEQIKPGNWFRYADGSCTGLGIVVSPWGAECRREMQNARRERDNGNA